MRKKASKRKRRVISKADIHGRRVGTKRSDMRWEDPDGTIWASKWEYGVWLGISKELGSRAERCSHAFNYASPVRQATCLHCGSSECVTFRTYTPDFYVHNKASADSERGGYYIEAKGYLRPQRRRLLRDFRKARQSIDLRLLFEKDYPATSSMSIVEWARRYLKCPVSVWNGKLPEDWR